MKPKKALTLAVWFSFSQITVGYSLHLDGIIDSEGANGTSNSGGGSGGSILIKTVLFSGHGLIVANGGRGDGNGGGGAGGRIAAHVAWLREYAGQYTAFGGTGLLDFSMPLFSLIFSLIWLLRSPLRVSCRKELMFL